MPKIFWESSVSQELTAVNLSGHLNLLTIGMDQNKQMVKYHLLVNS